MTLSLARRFSTTQWQTGATGIDTCTCIVGYYSVLPVATDSDQLDVSSSNGAGLNSTVSPNALAPVGAPSFECRRCGAGINCSVEGLATRTLPLLPGYWRASPNSSNTYRCPDASSGNSGCVGGTINLCKPSLTGESCPARFHCRTCLLFSKDPCVSHSLRYVRANDATRSVCLFRCTRLQGRTAPSAP